MSIAILKAGMQTTLQGAARAGHRHNGVPAAGPADPLSMSLANRLVSASETQTALEITLTGMRLVFTQPVMFSLTGAQAQATISGAPVHFHESTQAEAGDELVIGPAITGCRTYLAVSGHIDADDFLGSRSTYLPGRFGGFAGQALKDGDELSLTEVSFPEPLSTPMELRPHFNDRFLLQVAIGPDFENLTQTAKTQVFGSEFKVSQRSSRMGLEVIGETLAIQSSVSENRPSSAVFSGSVQLPPEGNPYILLSDAQTTGGYPHILQVIRSDRFQLGQMRSGAVVSFLKRTPQEANQRFRSRWAAFRDWLGKPVI